MLLKQHEIEKKGEKSRLGVSMDLAAVGGATIEDRWLFRIGGYLWQEFPGVVAKQQDLNTKPSSSTLGTAGLWVKAFIPRRTRLF